MGCCVEERCSLISYVRESFVDALEDHFGSVLGDGRLQKDEVVMGLVKIDHEIIVDTPAAAIFEERDTSGVDLVMLIFELQAE